MILLIKKKINQRMNIKMILFIKKKIDDLIKN